jgi:hypothetical protein
VKSYGGIAIVQGSLLWTDVNGYSPGALRSSHRPAPNGGSMLDKPGSAGTP